MAGGTLTVTVLENVHENSKQDIDKQVNDKRRPVRISSIDDVTEVDSHNYSAYCFYLRLAEMENGKWNHLDEYATLFKSLL